MLRWGIPRVPEAGSRPKTETVLLWSAFTLATRHHRKHPQRHPSKTSGVADDL